MSLDWAKLAEHFPDHEVKQRPGAAKWDHKADCQGARCRDAKDEAKHHQFSYVDARAVAQRLDDVLTPAGWTFTCAVIPGSDVVKGTLTIAGVIREDHGYPNSDRDEEPVKAATSDALKRCAVLFGVGRHLYEDNQRPTGRTNGHSAPVRTEPVAVARSSTAVPEIIGDLDWDSLSPIKPGAPSVAAVASPDGAMTFGELADRAKVANVPIRVLTDTSKRMFGQKFWKLTDLTGEQRWAVAEEVGLA